MTAAVDYRSSAWSLRDALAEGSLAKLVATPVRERNAAALAAARFTIDASATRRVGEELLALEAPSFRYLGTKGESASYGPIQPNDVFVDEDATTYVVVRRKRSFIGLSRYYILTYFADGTCLETVSRPKPILESGTRLIARGGTEDLVDDVKSHLAAVRKRALDGKTIVPVRTLDDVLALARYFVSHVCDESVAAAVAETRSNELRIVSFLVGAAAVISAIILLR